MTQPGTNTQRGPQPSSSWPLGLWQQGAVPKVSEWPQYSRGSFGFGLYQQIYADGLIHTSQSFEADDIAIKVANAVLFDDDADRAEEGATLAAGTYGGVHFDDSRWDALGMLSSSTLRQPGPQHQSGPEPPARTPAQQLPNWTTSGFESQRTWKFPGQIAPTEIPLQAHGVPRGGVAAEQKLPVAASSSSPIINDPQQRQHLQSNSQHAKVPSLRNSTKRTSSADEDVDVMSSFATESNSSAVAAMAASSGEDEDDWDAIVSRASSASVHWPYPEIALAVLQVSAALRPLPTTTTATTTPSNASASDSNTKTKASSAYRSAVSAVLVASTRLTPLLQILSQREAEETDAEPASGTKQLVQHVLGHMCLQVAAKARQENRLLAARLWYRSAAKVAPLWPRAWLELSKFEEDIGNMQLAATALLRGLREYQVANNSACSKAEPIHHPPQVPAPFRFTDAHASVMAIRVIRLQARLDASTADSSPSPPLSSATPSVAHRALSSVLKPHYHQHAIYRHRTFSNHTHTPHHGNRDVDVIGLSLSPPLVSPGPAPAPAPAPAPLRSGGGDVPPYASRPKSHSGSPSSWSSDEDASWLNSGRPTGLATPLPPTASHIWPLQQPSPQLHTTAAGSGNGWPWRVLLEAALLEWRLGRRQLAIATLDHVQHVLPHRAQPYLHTVDLLKKESRFIEAYRVAMKALRLLPSAGMLWFEVLALQLHILLTVPSWSSMHATPTSTTQPSHRHYHAILGDLPWCVFGLGGYEHAAATATATASAASPCCPSCSCCWLATISSRLRLYGEQLLPQLQRDALQHLSPELTHRFLIEVARAHAVIGDHLAGAHGATELPCLSELHCCPPAPLQSPSVRSAQQPSPSPGPTGEVAHLTRARHAFACAIRAAPSNLQYKVWLEGARLELRYGDKKVARKCMLAALQYAPLKSRTAVLIDWARLEQYLGGSTGTDTDTDTNSDSDGDGGGFQEARRILAKTKSLVPSDWKVHLESILLELRAGAILQALELARTALRMFPSSGRLWALRVQLEFLNAVVLVDQQQQQRPKPNTASNKTTAPSPSNAPTLPRRVIRALEQATQQCPKSGEVWCEAARLAIFVGEFSLARRYLQYSTHFTPQLGDSLVEWLRLELLEQEVAGVRHPTVDQSALYATVCHADLSPPNYGMVWAFCRQLPLDSTLHTLLVSTQRHLLQLRSVSPSLDIASWVATLSFVSLDSPLRFRLLFD